MISSPQSTTNIYLFYRCVATRSFCRHALDIPELSYLNCVLRLLERLISGSPTLNSAVTTAFERYIYVLTRPDWKQAWSLRTNMKIGNYDKRTKAKISDIIGGMRCALLYYSVAHSIISLPRECISNLCTAKPFLQGNNHSRWTSGQLISSNALSENIAGLREHD